MVGHKQNLAKKRWREKFKRLHPEGAKAYAKAKRLKRSQKPKSSKNMFKLQADPEPEPTPAEQPEGETTEETPEETAETPEETTEENE